MKQYNLSLVIPVHNEHDIIEQVIRNYYHEVVEKLPGAEFIVAEDGSTDGTKEILKKLSEELPIIVISGDRRKGYAAAAWDGLKLCKNEVIFFSDSDGQHSPADFWKMIPFIEEFDVITGYKYPRQDAKIRLMISHVMNTIVWALFGIKLRDINCGFRVMRKEVVDNVIQQRFLSDFFSTEFIIRAHHKGYRAVEVPIKHYTRPYGDSRWLSTKKLPKIITKILINLLQIKLEFLCQR